MVYAYMYVCLHARMNMYMCMYAVCTFWDLRMPGSHAMVFVEHFLF